MDVSGISLPGKDVPLREYRRSKVSSDVDQIQHWVAHCWIHSPACPCLGVDMQPQLWTSHVKQLLNLPVQLCHCLATTLPSRTAGAGRTEIMPLPLELIFASKVSSCLLTVPLFLYLYQAFILPLLSAPSQKHTLQTQVLSLADCWSWFKCCQWHK